MQHTIIHVGLDVDDTQYHGSALDKRTGEVIDFKCRPTLKGLLSQLDKLARHFPGCTLKLCYEVSYIGFTLQRDLAEKGYACEVVAPTSIPSPRGKQIKTDRIDASQLAHYYANGLLTLVSIPELQQEQDRDLLRTRQKLMEQQTELRKHLQALLRRNGLHYKARAQSKTHWTKQHYDWLERTIETASGSLNVNLTLLLRQLKALNGILAQYRVVFFNDPIEQGLLGPVTLVTTSVLVPAGHPGRHLGHDPRTVEPLRASFSTSSLTLRSSLRYCVFIQFIAQLRDLEVSAVMPASARHCL